MVNVGRGRVCVYVCMCVGREWACVWGGGEKGVTLNKKTMFLSKFVGSL